MHTLLLLNTVTLIGEMLMVYGAEIYRVEQTIERISRAYGAKEIDVFAIPSSIVVTISTDGENFHTKTKRIHSRSTDLDKIHRLNALSRKACQEQLSLEALRSEAISIKNTVTYTAPWQYLAYAVASFSFTMFFGGELIDGVVSLGIGCLVRFASGWLNRLGSNPFFTNAICSGAISAVAFGSVWVGFAINMDKIIMGCLMMLVPGIAITNSMRDIINGDLISGSLKLVEAFIVATAIAVGVTGMLSIAYKLAEVMA